MSFETVIGLEIHAQLLTETKLFCACERTTLLEQNTKTCDICLGMPGSLPVLNEHAVGLAVRAAMALHCKINPDSVFARKNYFYPDLPKGYQISQYDRPLATDGWVTIGLNGKTKRIGITRVHLEEDAGKNIHEGSDRVSFIDYNRSCVPLIEIVSEPDISSPEEATEYLRILRLILLYNGISDGNMELGNLRCDANISVRRTSQKKFGTKTELKNMNSPSFIEKALGYELERQTGILNKGGNIVQETLLWDTASQKTVPMRTKEEAHDYRYFPEPDLLPLKLDRGFVDKIKSEFPLTFSETLMEQYDEYLKMKIPESTTNTIINFPDLHDIFKKAMKVYSKNPQRSATLITDIFAKIKDVRAPAGKVPEWLSRVVESEDQNRINLNTGKVALEKSLKTGKDPAEIIEAEGLLQISDKEAIDSVVEKVLKDHAKQVAQYKSGKEGIFNFLLGQVMRETRGKVNPNIATGILKEKLGK